MSSSSVGPRLAERESGGAVEWSALLLLLLVSKAAAAEHTRTTLQLESRGDGDRAAVLAGLVLKALLAAAAAFGRVGGGGAAATGPSTGSMFLRDTARRSSEENHEFVNKASHGAIIRPGVISKQSHKCPKSIHRLSPITETESK